MRRSVSILVAASLAARAGFAPTYAAMPSPPAFVGNSGNLIPVVDDNDRKPTWYPKKKNKRGNVTAATIRVTATATGIATGTMTTTTMRPRPSRLA